MDKLMNLRILLRNDIAENWVLANPILGKGEMGIEIDTQRFKVGDGVTPWNLLPYSSTNYIAGNGIVINNETIALDDLILDCGTSTTII